MRESAEQEELLRPSQKVETSGHDLCRQVQRSRARLSLATSPGTVCTNRAGERRTTENCMAPIFCELKRRAAALGAYFMRHTTIALRLRVRF
jgi:hypothetical protein